MVLAAVAGGLRDLLLARDEPVADLMLRASVPVSLHQEQSGRPQGNQVGWRARAAACRRALPCAQA